MVGSTCDGRRIEGLRQPVSIRLTARLRARLARRRPYSVTPYMVGNASLVDK